MLADSEDRALSSPRSASADTFVRPTEGEEKSKKTSKKDDRGAE
jgi:hypothetical protein